MLLSGEGGDEVFYGYLYLKEFPTEELFARQIECIGFLHNNASLRLELTFAPTLNKQLLTVS